MFCLSALIAFKCACIEIQCCGFSDNLHYNKTTLEYSEL